MNNVIRLTALFAAPGFCWVTGAQTTQQPEEAPSFINEAIVDAPIAAVWKVWTSSEGYKLVGVALADVDFRVGGLIRSRYSAAGVLGDDETIENRILAYEPRRMIAIRIERPPKSFPFREAWKSTWTVVTLSDLGNNRTHIRVASMGYGSDQESMAMRRFFESGNAATLKTLQSRFRSSANGEREK
jgi:uncharacterized protein YndB with AHSA1/START domain